MMKSEMMTKEAVCSSLRTKLTATPSTHMMATLYTDIPTYLFYEESVSYVLLRTLHNVSYVLVITR